MTMRQTGDGLAWRNWVALTFHLVSFALHGIFGRVLAEFPSDEDWSVFERRRVVLEVQDVPLLVDFLHHCASHAEWLAFAFLCLLLNQVDFDVVWVGWWVTVILFDFLQTGKVIILFILLTLLGTDGKTRPTRLEGGGSLKGTGPLNWKVVACFDGRPGPLLVVYAHYWVAGERGASTALVVLHIGVQHLNPLVISASNIYPFERAGLG